MDKELTRIVRAILADEIPAAIRWAADAPGAKIPPLFRKAKHIADGLKKQNITLEQFDSNVAKGIEVGSRK